VKLIIERSALEACKVAPNNKHFISVIKISKLMQCKEIIAVCVEISHLTEHINALFVRELSFICKT